MGCCKPNEPMPGMKKEPKDNGTKVLIAIILLIILLGGTILMFL